MIMKLRLTAALTTSAILSVSAFQPNIRRSQLASRSEVLMSSRADGTDASLDRRTFFSSTVNKAAVASLILTSSPPGTDVANAADAFPKVYKPAANSMDGKLGTEMCFDVTQI
jgi:hypothetical protein